MDTILLGVLLFITFIITIITTIIIIIKYYYTIISLDSRYDSFDFRKFKVKKDLSLPVFTVTKESQRKGLGLGLGKEEITGMSFSLLLVSSSSS